ncbi:MAG: EAL domain-containing protein [Burkholderiales bacterium]|nr:EAL domain-containing protein [Burkholderiales bacterium]
MNGARFKILVVDDDAGARLVMRAAMSKAGFAVRMAAGGQDALDQFRAEPADMVMLDVDMPGLDGYQVCTALRAEAGPLLPIVMVTGMDDLASVETAYLHGATDFISKPVNWALMVHRVKYLFRGYQALLDLQASEARNKAILAAIPDALFELDIDGCWIECRAPRADLLPAPPQALLGRTVGETLPPAAAQAFTTALHGALEQGSSVGEQFELELPRGRTWFELSVSRKAVGSGQKPLFIVLARDITERKQSEEKIARLAYFDSLTGLPNRQSFLDRVDREIARAERSGKRLALLYLDLDGFKNINDTLGHAAGDLILKWAADRLWDGLRPSDLLSRVQVGFRPDALDFDLARLGGDEFTAMLLGLEHPNSAMTVAQRLGESMRRPFVLDGREIALTSSIGIAIYPEDGTDAATLLKHADTAMYHAKNSGRDNAQSYNVGLTDEIVRRLELDTSLRAALERREFHLVYQPQVDVASGRIRSVEALLRWIHPLRGSIAPAEFIPRAEETGLIERLGQWVLETACADAARWHAQGLPLKVAVNLSPLQFTVPGLPEMVRDVLARSGLPPQSLELEVTEGAVMENTAATHAALQALRAQGALIALDDFGTGYSSLSYLTRMPITNIKIDRCFVHGLLHEEESEAIIRAILAMAKGLGMRVTAEGVETGGQADALRAMGCDSLQGFLFSRPVLADAIPALAGLEWRVADGAAPASDVEPGTVH